MYGMFVVNRHSLSPWTTVSSNQRQTIMQITTIQSKGKKEMGEGERERAHTRVEIKSTHNL